MSFLTTYAGKMLMTFLLAMVPVLELRFAIPYGVASGLSIWVSIAVSVLGNLVPAPLIILFIRRIFAWLREKSQRLRSLVERLEARAEGKKDVVRKYAFWGLVILVAIPLPGTGAWTGSLVAAMMNMRTKDALPAIALGVVIAGVIVSVITYGAKMVF